MPILLKVFGRTETRDGHPEIARADHPDIDFRVDSCTEFATLKDWQFEVVIAN